MITRTFHKLANAIKFCAHANNYKGGVFVVVKQDPNLYKAWNVTFEGDPPSEDIVWKPKWLVKL